VVSNRSAAIAHNMAHIRIVDGLFRGETKITSDGKKERRE
jgi:hypothetical protein